MATTKKKTNPTKKKTTTAKKKTTTIKKKSTVKKVAPIKVEVENNPVKLEVVKEKKVSVKKPKKVIKETEVDIISSYKEIKPLNLKKPKKTFNSIYFIAIFIIALEFIFKYVSNLTINGSNILYTLIFSLVAIFTYNILTKIFSYKVNKWLFFIIGFLITAFFEFQFIFITLFDTPFSFSTISLANQALDFTYIIFTTIIANIFGFILLFIPFILLIIFARRIDYTKYYLKGIIVIIVLLICSIVFAYFSLDYKKDDTESAHALFYDIDNPKNIESKFGLITGEFIDIKRVLFGFSEKIVIDSMDEEEIVPEEKYNVLDLDFSEDSNSSNSEIASLSAYFNTVTGTKQNDYTGLFKGKNLIFIMAEGFNEIAVSESLTPTLYKLTHEGFVFNNFYSPVFLSTTGGEFQATTGLIPTQETLSLWKKNTPTISFALGNEFSKLDYKVTSYHDWTYTYYSRQKTMPTLGYMNFIACGNGLEKKMNCKSWPPSDVNMVDVTTNDFLSTSEPFLTYYFTVSGHAEYNFTGQNIISKNKDLVSGLTVSTPAKAYIASQIELDKALELLINRLTESGELENTVIALVGDHYPYTLDIDTINELSTYEKDSLFEVNHSNFILWNSEMEPVEIDKVGSQIDVLPTLLNLFGIDYDSRLIVGHDILSDTSGLAIFSNRSWLSDKGRYNSSTKEFIQNPNTEVADDYVTKMNNIVANDFAISKKIIATDYYNYILGGK